MAGNISLSDILHNRPAVVPTIYGYTLPDVADHNGYIKIGYTDREDTETRIKEQLHTAAIPFRILFKESAMRSDGTCFLLRLRLHEQKGISEKLYARISQIQKKQKRPQGITETEDDPQAYFVCKKAS